MISPPVHSPPWPTLAPRRAPVATPRSISTPSTRPPRRWASSSPCVGPARSTTSRCSELQDGRIKTYDIDPAVYFENYCTNADLEGGAPADNAAITRGILEGKITGPKRDIVLINSAASLLSANRCADLAEGIRQSAAAIDSGAALDKLEKLVAFSKS